jgi:hypothetical protein
MIRKRILILYQSNTRTSGIERVGDVIKMIAPTRWGASSCILRSCRDMPSRGIRKFEVIRVLFFAFQRERSE